MEKCIICKSNLLTPTQLFCGKCKKIVIIPKEIDIQMNLPSEIIEIISYYIDDPVELFNFYISGVLDTFNELKYW